MNSKEHILTLDIVGEVQPLFYFDIFSYPLTFKEICDFSQHKAFSKDKLKFELELLVNEGILYEVNGFYLLENKKEQVSKRLDSNRRADEYLAKAKEMSKLIARFPFVKAIFVSGSLSKHSMSEDGDIDYFIVTEPNRLWIARTLLVVFKKIFLFNSHKYFCVNYFVDENHLEIEEQNRFTATEIATLLPMYGKAYYEQLMEQNNWIKAYYPNYPLRETTMLKPSKRGFIQKVLELPFYGRFGDWVDDFLMNKTFNYWKNKFKHISANRFEIALKSRKYVSKHHPSDFQKKVLEAYEEGRRKFSRKIEQRIRQTAKKAT